MGGKMNVSVLRLVVAILGAVCGVCLVGIIVLAGMGKEPPAALASICSISAGALIGILVPSTANSKRTPHVEAIPVEEE